MSEAKWVKRTLEIVACVEGYKGSGQEGSNYTIYNVTAKDQAGNVISHKLSSFENLPTGVGEFEVSPYPPGTTPTHPDFKNFTVRTSGGKGSMGKKVDALREELAAAVQRIDRLEEEVKRLGTGSPVPASDDDIPF